MKVFCGFALACLLACLAGTAAAGASKRATFAVTVHATVTKDWNSVVESTEGSCAVFRRAIGHRTVTLRSSRPMKMVVTLRDGKATFSPPAVRFVTVQVAQRGENRTRREPPCRTGTEREPCEPASRRIGGASFRFFRSGRNELSFHSARLPGAGSTCPRESAPVRAIRPDLREAQGAISEIDLAASRSQTALASAELTTDLDGAETGRVVERIRWSLTFTRR